MNNESVDVKKMLSDSIIKSIKSGNDISPAIKVSLSGTFNWTVGDIREFLRVARESNNQHAIDFFNGKLEGKLEEEPKEKPKEEPKEEIRFETVVDYDGTTYDPTYGSNDMKNKEIIRELTKKVKQLEDDNKELNDELSIIENNYRMLQDENRRLKDENIVTNEEVTHLEQQHAGALGSLEPYMIALDKEATVREENERLLQLAIAESAKLALEMEQAKREATEANTLFENVVNSYGKVSLMVKTYEDNINKITEEKETLNKQLELLKKQRQEAEKRRQDAEDRFNAAEKKRMKVIQALSQ